MPFQSKAQVKKMRQLEREGKVAKGTVAKWAAETPAGKLPERKHEKPKTSPMHRVRGK